MIRGDLEYSLIGHGIPLDLGHKIVEEFLDYLTSADVLTHLSRTGTNLSEYCMTMSELKATLLCLYTSQT